MAEPKPPVCEECHRPLLRPSPDGLGPVCRRKHPELARTRRWKTVAAASARVKPGVIPGQEELFETLEGCNEC